MEIKSRTQNLAADGGIMPTYVAEPTSGGPYPIVIVFMEAFGVSGHIKNVTNRFASDGYVAIAPDLYYRNEPNIVVDYTDIQKAMPLLRGMYDAQTHADTRTAINFAKDLTNTRADSIGCTGYCMGGTISWMTACLNRDIKAAAIYYPGGIITRETSVHRPASPHAYAELLTAPVLGLFGEDDQSPPPADVKEIDAELTKLGKTHDFHIYKGAGHGFSCNERASFHQSSSDDAWSRTLAWFEKYLKS
jgi:carboxymethylenebutenolidase